ncbi:MAG: hypothetical protein ACI9OU_000511 [Candidatus Promineifilaceae bacterium]|jgi:hypothetical protein
MAANSLTEITGQSWLGRIGSSLKGVIFGLLLFVVAFPVLFLNEGRSVKTYKSIQEAGGTVISVGADAVSADNAGTLIHITGKAVTEATLRDPIFGVTAQALKLKRSVAMYQWKEKSHSEEKKKLGGGTETVTRYTYDKGWSDTPIPSADFYEPEGHKNPDAFPYVDEAYKAKPILVGAFELSPSLVSRIDNFTPLNITDDTPLPTNIAANIGREAGKIYLGQHSATPTVGDLRVSFSVALPTEVSIISQQINNTFEAFQTKAGRAFERLQIGQHSAEAMIAQAQQENKTLTWGLRLLGFIIMMIGLNLIFKPLSVLADVVPFLGALVGVGTGLIAFLIAISLSFTVIAIAWVVFRPLLGIGLLVVAGAATYVIITKLKAARPQIVEG